MAALVAVAALTDTAAGALAPPLAPDGRNGEAAAVAVRFPPVGDTSGVSTHTLFRGGAGGPAITPDGSVVVYSATLNESLRLRGYRAGPAAPTAAIETRPKIWLHRRTNLNVVVSKDDAGNEINGSSPDVSDDGNQVVFVASDSNVYLRDRAVFPNRTLLVSGTSIPGVRTAALDPSISGKGTRVAYTSHDFSIRGAPDRVHLFDRDDGRNVALTASGGTVPDGATSNPSLSGDGRWLAFTSTATNLAADDTGARSDVLVADLADPSAPRYTLISRTAAGLPGNGNSFAPSISDDGRFVAFFSEASDLLTGDTNGKQDVFVFDRDADENGTSDETTPGATTTVRASVDTFGAQVADPMLSDTPSMSPDGSVVGFTTAAALAHGSILSDLDTNRTRDVYAFTVATGDVERVSLHNDDGQRPQGGYSPAMATGGRHVAFTSTANLDPFSPSGNVSSSGNVYRRDRPVSLSIEPTAADFGLVPVGTTSEPVTFTVRNGGPAVATSYRPFLLSPDAGFTIVDDQCKTRPLPPGRPCTLAVRFAPPARGVAATNLLSGFDESNGPSAQLTGRGGVSALTVDPPGSFGTTKVGTTSATHRITVHNQDAAVAGSTDLPVTVTSVTLADTPEAGGPADFRVVDDTCTAAAIAPDGTCTIDVALVPTASGRLVAALQLGHDATNTPTPAAVPLNGVGSFGALTVEPMRPFGTTKVGTASSAERVVVRNRDPKDPNAPLVPVTIGKVVLVADPIAPVGGPADFTIVADGCAGKTLAPEGTCSIDIVFNPTSTGTLGAALHIGHDADGTPDPVVVGLIGTGARGRLDLTPSPLDLGNAIADSVPGSATVTATNAGPVDVTIAGSSLGGSDPEQFTILANGCSGINLPIGGSCVIEVRLVPRFAGRRTAELALANDGTVNPALTTLTGVVVPVLEVDPQLGIPGFVPTAIGRGFPPGADIELRWVERLGIGQARAGADGTFRAPMLLLRRDLLGPRQLEASGAGFDPVQLAKPFLVLPPTVRPPGFVVRI